MDRPCWCEVNQVTLLTRFANAGEGGAFLRTTVALDVGQRLRLSWECPDAGGQVVAQAAVVRKSSPPPGCGPRGVGLRFLSFEKNGEPFLRAVRGGGRERSTAW
jgi:hypothetical protein